MSDAENDRPEAQPLAGADLDETPTELVDLASLRPHPRNYKRHPQDQVDHVLETMRLAGVYKNIVIARDGTILMGHGVVEAATQAGRKRISARRLDVDPDDPRALKLVAADNEISDLADRDDAALAAILNDVLGAGVGLLGSGLDEAALAALAGATGGDAAAGAGKLAERFLVPPFSVLDARQGYWQERKRAWLALGIKSELGRTAPIGGGAMPLDRAKMVGGARKPRRQSEAGDEAGKERQNRAR